jgi:D-sedoheptulose 7-phosphate isomerase
LQITKAPTAYSAGGLNLMTSAAALFIESLQEHIRVVEQLRAQQDTIARIADKIIDALAGGRIIFWCGNGGSAADSQHLAAELVGRFQRERDALASVALTTDTSVLTAIGNDYGFDAVFARQVAALARPGDILICISTSGNSPNVCAAAEKARELGVYTIALTGGDGGRLRTGADMILSVSSLCVARVQEAHILIGHLICDRVEAEYAIGR